MPHPAGSSDTSGLGAQSVLGPFIVATRESRQGFPRRLAVALCLRGGVLCRAALERGLCLPRPWDARSQ